MKRSEVQAWLDDQGIDCRTITLCVATNDEGEPAREDEGGSEDGWFGTCDISGDRGHVYKCQACTKDGDAVDFDAGEWLIGGALGRIAGAF